MDDRSSVVADFQMLGYKVDKINFSVQPIVANIQDNDLIDRSRFKLQIRIRNPQRFCDTKGSIVYVGGLDMKIKLLSSSNKRKVIASGNFGIAGSFVKNNKAMPSNQEKYMVLKTIPSVLLGYLRSTITSVFATAGFGSVLIPLLNINAIANDAEPKILNPDGTIFELS